MRHTLKTLLVAAAVLIALPTFATSGKSDTYRNALVNQFFRSTTITFPGALSVKLYSTCPTASTGGTELTGNAYVAQTYSPGVGNWTAAASGMTQNSIAVTFPTVTTSAWTVNCVALENSGTIYYWGDVTGKPVTVNVGATASFAINALQVTEASLLPDLSELVAYLGRDMVWLPGDRIAGFDIVMSVADAG